MTSLVVAQPASASGGFTITVILTPTSSIDLSIGQTTTALAQVKRFGINTAGTTVTFSTSALGADGGATFSASTCVTGSTGQCAVTVLPGTASGSQSVVASMNNALGSATSSPATLTQYFSPLGTPATVTLSFANGINRIAPNGVATTNAIVTIKDASNNPVLGHTVHLATDATTNPVTFSSMVLHSDGTYTSTVTAPKVQERSIPSQTITSTVDGSALSGTQSLAIAAPSLHTVSYSTAQQNPNPAPGIYDDFGRRVSLAGVDGVHMWGANQASVDGLSQTNGGLPVGEYHMAGSQWVALDTTTGAGSIAWNANVVRFELSDVFWCATNTACDTPTESNNLLGTCGDAYRQKIMEHVDRLTKMGVLVLLDLHGVPALSDRTANFNCTNNTGDNATGVLRAMADLAYAPLFWEQVARQYADNPLVAFELFNEPRLTSSTFACGNQTFDGGTLPATNANDPATTDNTPVNVWLKAGLDGYPYKVKGSTAGTYKVAGMQLLYNAVRDPAKGGANNLVFVGGLGPHDVHTNDAAGYNTACDENAAWDISPALTHPVVGVDGGDATNVVYDSHPYHLGICLNDIPDSADAAVGVVTAQYPVVFSEFGHQCSLPSVNQTFNQNVVNYAVGHGIGFIAYAFVPHYADHLGVYACTNYSPSAKCSDGETGGETGHGAYLPYEPNSGGVPSYNRMQITAPLN